MDMNKLARLWILFMAAMFLCCVVAWAFISMGGCSTVRDAQRLEEMDDAEAELFAQRLAYQIAVVAQAAIEEGDLSKDAVGQVAEAFRGLAVGSSAGAAGGLAELIDVNGYGAAALALAVSELDAELARAGALEPGGAFSARARAVFAAVADELGNLTGG